MLHVLPAMNGPGRMKQSSEMIGNCDKLLDIKILSVPLLSVLRGPDCICIEKVFVLLIGVL